MSLIIVPTPIGDYGDITLRAKSALEQAHALIAEEHRPASTLLKKLGLAQKEIYLLNEHSRDHDLKELVELCAVHDVALVSDCGTPNFCDPGAALVKALRGRNIPVRALPGPSSLMTVLSLSSERLEQFVFRGFLPADRELRQKRLRELAQESRAQVLMETPYRLVKWMEELAGVLPKRKALLALDLTLPTEKILEGPLGRLASQVEGLKAEPVLLIYPHRP